MNITYWPGQTEQKKTVFCRTASLQSCFPHLSIKYSCTAAGCSCNFTSSRSPKDSHCIPGLLAPHRCLLLCLSSLSIRLDRYSQIITFINFREFTKVAQAISGVNVTTSGSTRGENRALKFLVGEELLNTCFAICPMRNETLLH